MYKESRYNMVIDTDSAGRVLLYNTNTGALCWFNPETLSTFSGKSNIDEKDIKPDIIRLGYAVPIHIDEMVQLDFCKKCYVYDSSPKTLHYVIAPTLSCNFKCEYCFEQDTEQKSTMSSKTWESLYSFIVSQHSKYPSAKGIQITWFGGEPCLQIESIRSFSKRIIAYANQNNLEYGAFVVTNGTLLTIENATCLKDECYVHGVQITLDGLRDEYERRKRVQFASFDTVIKNIVAATQYFKVHIRINVDRKNKNDIIPLIHYLMEDCHLCGKISLYLAPIKAYSNEYSGSGIDGCEFEDFREQVIDDIIRNHYEKSIKIKMPEKIARACGAMRNFTCVVGPKGELYRCEHTLGMPEWVIGDVTSGFYHNMVDSKFIDLETPIKCQSCKLLPLCAGGCTADRLLHGFEFDCAAFEKRILSSVKLAMKFNSGRK